MENQPWDSDHLGEEALFSRLMYKTLSTITPEDADGIQRAYISDFDNGMDILIPRPEEGASLACYGVEPTLIAKMDEPFQIIPKNSPQELMDSTGKMNRSLLREMLRQIVDEV